MGLKDIRDYVTQLRKLAKRLGDVTEVMLARKLWRSVQSYLRIEWTEAGFDCETHTLTELLESGIHFENAKKSKRSACGVGNRQNAFRRCRPPPARRPDNPRPISRPNRETQTHRTLHSASIRPSAPAKAPGGRNTGSRPGQSRNGRPNGQARMSESKQKDLRARGLCFMCEQPGHMAQNCPKGN
jgi:hypothetical protein